MATKTITHNRKKISAVDVHDTQHLFISGEHIPAKALKGRYWSPHLPYQKFDTLHDLGKAIVDYRAMDKKKKR